MSETEQAYIVAVYSFELSKVEQQSVRGREVNQILLNIDPQLAVRVVANADVRLAVPANPAPQLRPSPALGQMNLLSDNIRSRRVTILIVDSVAESDVSDPRDVLRQENADAKLIVSGTSSMQTENGVELIPEETWDGLSSVASDAVFVPGGTASSQAISMDGHGLHHPLEAYKHLKSVVSAGDTQTLTSQLSLPGDPSMVPGTTAIDVFPGLCQTLMQHRIWQREATTKTIPA